MKVREKPAKKPYRTIYTQIHMCIINVCVCVCMNNQGTISEGDVPWYSVVLCFVLVFFGGGVVVWFFFGGGVHYSI